MKSKYLAFKDINKINSIINKSLKYCNSIMDSNLDNISKFDSLNIEIKLLEIEYTLEKQKLRFKRHYKNNLESVIQLTVLSKILNRIIDLVDILDNTLEKNRKLYPEVNSKNGLCVMYDISKFISISHSIYKIISEMLKDKQIKKIDAI